MSLRIEINNEALDLPVDFGNEIQMLSPVYSDKGSQTVAVTIPPSPRNMRLTGFAHRLDAVSKPAIDVEAVISDGVYRRTAKMNIISASSATGVELNFGLDESLMYEAWSDVKLRSIANLPELSPAGGVADLISHLNEVYNYTATADYAVFPIVLSRETVDDVEYPLMLNEIYNSTNNAVGANTYLLRSGRRVINIVRNSTVVATTVPQGYGISPFLYVWRVLELLFSSYGFTLTENPFLTHHQLSHLVVLNNVADAIVSGTLRYSDLLPTCTINEFLEALKVRFGAVVFINADSMTARIVFLKDILSATPAEDWTALQTGRAKVTYNTAKQLKLSSSTSFEGASTCEDDYDSFVDKYSAVMDVYEGEHSSLDSQLPLLYERSTGLIYKKKSTISNQGETNVSYNFFSSPFFAWYKGTDNVEAEELSGPDESLPMNFATFGGLTVLCPCYLCGDRNIYTAIIMSADTGESGAENDTPLSFCFAHPLPAGSIYYGSSLCRTPTGARLVAAGHTWNISLIYAGEDGAFNRFFKEYDAVLRHANQSVEYDGQVIEKLIAGIDFAAPVTVSGQPMMLEQLNQKLPLPAGRVSVIKMRTLKLLQPYNLSVEQDLRLLTTPEYVWWYNLEEIISDMNTAVYNLMLARRLVNPDFGGYIVIEQYSIDTELQMLFSWLRTPTAEDISYGKTYTANIAITVSRVKCFYAHDDEFYYVASTHVDALAVTGRPVLTSSL